MEKIISTVGMSHEDWLRQRKRGIGGSDAGAICGLNPYVSPMQIYLDKTSEEIQEKDNESMRQGRDLEEYVAQRFMEATGKKVRRANMIFGNKKFPFMFANVDRLIVGENAGLECKTASAYSVDKWKEGIPAHYMIQCLHYMAVTNTDAWYIAVVILGREFKYFKIERDDNMIANLISIEKKFWECNVMNKIIPSPDGTEISDDVINQYFSETNKDKVVSIECFNEKLERRMELDKLIQKLDQEKKQIEQEIKMYMNDAEAGTSNTFAVSWKNCNSSRLDTTKLKNERPDIYNNYVKVQHIRRFAVKMIA